ncbi:toxin secretion/phage lysis holin [Sedimentibacter acidaminivorans]|uniref:Toxin secretion/phage lysis holin n=1 Tax=Sedimentibacter acidaminivorans TaxID=913099 RepID=A0ABS4GGK8_9FIRM|nr:phage holin family protein [Sedimentibacter acidaminivorans]MBP1926833.1 toxin secretion/phage lysis holin [Sedimentibacter acidaminivorans]
MENINSIKIGVLSIFGITGSIIANLLGGWDMALQTLILFMAVDYITGLITAGVFKKSNKSETGALESKAGWKGLSKKGVTLLIVLISAQLDRLTGMEVIRDAVIIAYAVNEALSIIENAGLMGIPIPTIITKALDALQNKEGGTND